jgi:cyclopropane-fatty-acyl-phospholipid synthase
MLFKNNVKQRLHQIADKCLVKPAIDGMEMGLLPDWLIRKGIKKLCAQRISHLQDLNMKSRGTYTRAYAEQLRAGPLAIATKEANSQHYEVPAEFFNLALGPNRKYSSAYWGSDTKNLGEAEVQSLEQTVHHARIENGMRVLELGCGWGSITLYMAKKFPKCQIVAVSNSGSQKKFIDAEALRLGLTNVQVHTQDVSKMQTAPELQAGFDRIVSVEMFEHFRNYEILFSHLKKWLKPEGFALVHVFTHTKYPYLFDTGGSDNWMGQYFFTGGQMPSTDLFHSFHKDMKVVEQWHWSGDHYGKTSEAWLENMDSHKKEIKKILEPVYGKREVARWIQRWRIFFLAVAETFAYDKGSEWGVDHYLLAPAGAKT